MAPKKGLRLGRSVGWRDFRYPNPPPADIAVNDEALRHPTPRFRTPGWNGLGKAGHTAFLPVHECPSILEALHRPQPAYSKGVPTAGAG
jgi:hypothetical protein